MINSGCQKCDLECPIWDNCLNDDMKDTVRSRAIPYAIMVGCIVLFVGLLIHLSLQIIAGQ
jgi:hypothetical protein